MSMFLWPCAHSKELETQTTNVNDNYYVRLSPSFFQFHFSFIRVYKCQLIFTCTNDHRTVVACRIVGVSDELFIVVRCWWRPNHQLLTRKFCLKRLKLVVKSEGRLIIVLERVSFKLKTTLRRECSHIHVTARYDVTLQWLMDWETQGHTIHENICIFMSIKRKC